jgi:hypothetical protein
MTDLTAKARIREAAMELFAEVGYATEIGLRVLESSSGFRQAQRWGPGVTRTFRC